MNDLTIQFDDGIDLSLLDRHMDQVATLAERGILAGLRRGMDDLEAVAKRTTAYRGMSGATRASTVGYVAGTPDGRERFAAAYAAAAELLTDFQGHDGRPFRVSESAIDDTTIVGVLTVPTDYIDHLEFDAAGAKAFLGPTLAAGAANVTQQIANASREELGP